MNSDINIQLDDLSAEIDDAIENPAVLIFTAIEDLEQRILHEQLQQAGAKKIAISSFDQKFNAHQWRLPDKCANAGMLVATKCLNHAGNAKAGIELMAILNSIRPGLICFCGIAGSLKPSDFPLASVVVGQRVHWKGFDKISGEDLSWEMRSKLIDSFSLDESILNPFRRRVTEVSETGKNLNSNPYHELKNEAKKWYHRMILDPELADDLSNFDALKALQDTPKIQFSNILSWDYVLNRRDLRDAVAREDKGLSCVEMESGGLFMAATRSKSDWLNRRVLTVRGLSDLCFRKSDDFWRDISCRNASSVLIDYLMDGYLVDL